MVLCIYVHLTSVALETSYKSDMYVHPCLVLCALHQGSAPICCSLSDQLHLMLKTKGLIRSVRPFLERYSGVKTSFIRQTAPTFFLIYPRAKTFCVSGTYNQGRGETRVNSVQTLVIFSDHDNVQNGKTLIFNDCMVFPVAPPYGISSCCSPRTDKDRRLAKSVCFWYSVRIFTPLSCSNHLLH